MLDICNGFGQRHLMICNSKKSLCCHFGPGCLKIAPMKLGESQLNGLTRLNTLVLHLFQFLHFRLLQCYKDKVVCCF